jgi:hypothetical protein
LCPRLSLHLPSFFSRMGSDQQSADQQFLELLSSREQQGDTKNPPILLNPVPCILHLHVPCVLLALLRPWHDNQDCQWLCNHRDLDDCMYAVDSLQKDASVSLKRNFVWGVLEGRNHVDKECCVIPHLMLSEGETVDGRSLHLPDGRDPRGIYSSFKSQKDPKTTIFAGPINVSEAYKLLKIVHLLDISKLQNHAMFNRVNEKSHFNFKNEPSKSKLTS